MRRSAKRWVGAAIGAAALGAGVVAVPAIATADDWGCDYSSSTSGATSSAITGSATMGCTPGASYLFLRISIRRNGAVQTVVTKRFYGAQAASGGAATAATPCVPGAWYDVTYDYTATSTLGIKTYQYRTQVTCG